MTGLAISIVAFLANLVLVVILLVRYYGDRTAEAREETAFWREKARHNDGPNA